MHAEEAHTGSQDDLYDRITAVSTCPPAVRIVLIEYPDKPYLTVLKATRVIYWDEETPIGVSPIIAVRSVVRETYRIRRIRDEEGGERVIEQLVDSQAHDVFLVYDNLLGPRPFDQGRDGCTTDEITYNYRFVHCTWPESEDDTRLRPAMDDLVASARYKP